MTVLLAVLVLVVAALLWYQFWPRGEPPPPPVQATASAPVAAPAASEPAIQHPLPASQPPADFAEALRTLLGRAGLAFVQDSNFPARFVATVDNLGRDHAPVAAWPVVPTPGRFTTQAQGGRTLIAPDNARRYAAFVNWVDSVDTAAAVQLYKDGYPAFQQAYADLGLGKRYFNDRLVEVIDLLLRTPEPGGPLAVQLLEVKGPHQSQRPWVRYEFVDEGLQALPAGQKILLRMGPAHRQRLKAKLTEIRRGVTTGEAPQAPAAGSPAPARQN